MICTNCSLSFWLVCFWVVCVAVTTYTWEAKLGDEDAITIGAFNIRVFGRSKMMKNVSHHLVNIIVQHDLILIQEIRDSKGEAIKKLFEEIKNKTKSIDENALFEIIVSPRLGRSTSKEEYAYIYRSDKMKLLSSYTFTDVEDVFEREPFIAEFSSPLSAVERFVVAGIHISPRDALNEINNLTLVYESIVRKLNTSDVIIMGDFNAGCGYLKEWQNVTLAKDEKFYWLIDNSVDTTSESSNCPYDRIVVTGNNIVKAVIPESPAAFMFDKEFHLQSEKALEISDHYPVHMKLRLKEEQQSTNVQYRKVIYDKRVSSYVINNIYGVFQMRLKALRLSNYTVNETFTKSGAYIQITVSKSSSNFTYITSSLNEFRKDFPNFITRSQIAIAKRYMKRLRTYNHLPDGRNFFKTLKNYYMSKAQQYTVELICNLQNRKKPECGLQVFV